MKKIRTTLVCIFVILFCTSCSNNYNSIYLLAPEETKVHFEGYLSDLNEYGEIDSEWHGRSGGIFIYPNSSDALLIFDLYNQVPDEISPFSKETDDGYERYRIASNKNYITENEVCDFSGLYGNILSKILSKVTYKDISVDLIKDSFENMIGNKSYLHDKIDSSMLAEQVLYDEELYINNIWCEYYLSYYPVKKKFVERIYFGSVEHNNYVNLQTYN